MHVPGTHSFHFADDEYVVAAEWKITLGRQSTGTYTLSCTNGVSVMTEYIVANGANAYTPVIKPMLVPVVTKGFMAVMNWKDLTDQLGVR